MVDKRRLNGGFTSGSEAAAAAQGRPPPLDPPGSAGRRGWSGRTVSVKEVSVDLWRKPKLKGKLAVLAAVEMWTW